MKYDERGLTVGTEELESYAENLARSVRVTGVSGGRRAAAALRRTLRELDGLADALSLKWADVPSMPGAVRWLLDNRWLLRREGLAAARKLAAAERLRVAAAIPCWKRSAPRWSPPAAARWTTGASKRSCAAFSAR